MLTEPVLSAKYSVESTKLSGEIAILFLSEVDSQPAIKKQNNNKSKGGRVNDLFLAPFVVGLCFIMLLKLIIN